MEEGKEDNKEYQEPAKENYNTQKTKSVFSNIPTHNWAIATYILGVLSIILLITFFQGNITGNVISENKIEPLINDFINTQLLPDGGAVIDNIKSESGVYKVTIELEGESIPIYFTKDGSFITQGQELMKINNDGNPITGNVVQEPAEIPKSDKPIVEAFIMSHCPYGTQIEKGLIPVFEILGDKINSEIKFVYYAMHGKTEVKEQLNQYCIQKEQRDKFLDYLKCFLTDSNGESCLTQTGIDRARLSACAKSTDTQFDITKNLEDKSSWLSGRFPLFDIYKIENEKYQIGGSPTLVINGVQASSGRDSASLLLVICSAFNNEPEECSTQLSSTSPSAGFGYEAGSGSTGSCG